MKAHSTLTPIIHKRYLLAMALGLLVAISACSSEKAGLDKLRELCEKDAGLTIYKTVEADGYYDTTGSNVDLIHSDYQFFEYCDDSPTIVDLTPEPGCWRVSKVKRESGRCYEPLDKRLTKFVVEPYPEFLKENCIAVEKIEKPTARYSYHSNFKKWYSKNGISKFTQSDVFIQSDLTKEILGRYISYSYNTKPGHSIAKSCEIFEGYYPSFTEASLVNTVIQPIHGEIK